MKITSLYKFQSFVIGLAILAISLLSAASCHAQSTIPGVTTFGTLAAGNQPLSLLDSSFLAVQNYILTPPSISFSTGTGTATVLQGATGVNSSRFSFQPVNAAGTASSEIQLVPGSSCTGLCSQIQWFNAAGTNYERFDISAVNNTYIIDSTYNGTGTPRNIYFVMGGSVSNSVTGQNAIEIGGDSSNYLNGASFSASGKTWGANRTTIVDWANTGDSRLIIDTRTGTPASHVADDSMLDFRRGGAHEWYAGENADGANVDNFAIIGSGGGVSISQAGNVVASGTLRANTGGSANQAVCWKSGTILGYCSTVIAADGSCTCN